MLPNALETERTILKKLDKADIQFVHRIFSDASLIQYLDNELHHKRQSSHQLISTYSNHDHAFWLVKLKETNESVGLAGLYHFDKKHLFAQCKFVIVKQFQRRGFMLEAMQAIIQQVFSTGELHRIEAQIHIQNKGAQAFAGKIGFKLEGRLRENFLINGVFYDSLLYAIIPSDFS